MRLAYNKGKLSALSCVLSLLSFLTAFFRSWRNILGRNTTIISWAALYADSVMTMRVSIGPAIRRSQAQSRLRSYVAISRASFLPGLIYSSYPYVTCWMGRKDRALKNIPSLWRRPGESFVEVFFQLVLTRLFSSQDTVPGEHAFLRE